MQEDDGTRGTHTESQDCPLFLLCWVVSFRLYFCLRKAYLKEPQPRQVLKSNAVMPYINTNFTKGLRDLGLPEQSGGHC